MRCLHCPQIITRENIERRLRSWRKPLPKPFTDRLIYVYDYGDYWRFWITGSAGCSDLVENGVITRAALDRAVKKATVEQMPVLLARDGEMLVEDAGGGWGYLEFLKQVNLPPEAVIWQRKDWMDPDAPSYRTLEEVIEELEQPVEEEEWLPGKDDPDGGRGYQEASSLGHFPGMAQE